VSERWYKEAVIYCVEVDTFHDSDGDGHGDLRGLVSRLDYLAWLGVTCLWLNPIHPTPNRDDGYDVADYYGVDSRLGSLGDFADLAAQARERGIRLILDLVVNHTSDQHPWFQAARSDPKSPYRDWYVWSEKEPADRKQGIVFPGEQTETWTYDETAGAWYFHRFYDFQPDLNWANHEVREEIKKVMGFWLQLGASGFRIDAAPFVLMMVAPDDDDPPQDFGILDDWRQDVSWRKGDAVLLCEANVEPEKLPDYASSSPGGPNDRAHMLFGFLLNARMWLALARKQAEPIVEALRSQPQLPPMAQWATFLRNHDELDLSRLTKDQEAEVFKAFAPKPEMQLYGRGIRRRLAPMFKGDRQRIELAYSLQFSMPGTPVLRYGEEIGMGEDLALHGRDAIRTPMQWDSSADVGFSSADPGSFVRPAQTTGKYGARQVNVESQMTEADSLLRWFQQLLATLRMCPEIGVGSCTVVDVPLPPSVLAHRFEAPEGAILLLHNLGDKAAVVDLKGAVEFHGKPVEVFANTAYPAVPKRLSGIELTGYGYRWLRLRDR
jgi:maltose alpha-D-glucosyltransferase/alpha-amylase